MSITCELFLKDQISLPSYYAPTDSYLYPNRQRTKTADLDSISKCTLLSFSQFHFHAPSLDA